MILQLLSHIYMKQIEIFFVLHIDTQVVYRSFFALSYHT